MPSRRSRQLIGDVQSATPRIVSLVVPADVVITHPGLNTPELAALVDMNASNPLASMAMHRQGELDALLSPEFRRALARRPTVRLITYRDLAAMLEHRSARR